MSDTLDAPARKKPEPWKPSTKAAEGMDHRFRNLTQRERQQRALSAVMNDGEAQASAARRYGVSKGRLNFNVREERQRRAEMESRSSLAQDVNAGLVKTDEAGVPNLDVHSEARRVPPFAEFDRLYFGNLVCPDCGVHHPTPDFHREMMDVLGGPDKRVMFNLPPYHSKSVTGTVKSTIWELCRNPNSRHAIVSKSERLASKFLHSIVTYLMDPRLYDGAERNLLEDWGPFNDGSSQWNKGQIYLSGRTTGEKDPSVAAFGVGGHIYGVRAERFIFDDIADQENQRNPERVADMFRWATVEAQSRVGRNGKLIFIGTRVAPGDIYSQIERLPGYRVVRYPCITDEDTKQTLWGDHFPYDAASQMRDSMNPADWQLVYQNVDMPGLGAAFPMEVLEQCRDVDRQVGQFDSRWALVIGLDPAGGGDQSGHTAMVLMGVDLHTGKRHIVDLVNAKSLKAPQIMEQIYQWCEAYPVRELRVEVNGLQRQLFQYNQELQQKLTTRGVRIVPHVTSGNNKWDAQFGVESMSPMFYNKQISLPWGSVDTRHKIQPLIDQLCQFPMGKTTDMVMALWFADLACREIVQRQTAPMFDPRMKVPNYVKKRRSVVDFSTRQVSQWRPEMATDSGHLSMFPFDSRQQKSARFVNMDGEVLIP